MNTQNKIYIQNFWYENNYGACLTAYALYQMCVSLGYDTYLIDNGSTGQHLSFLFGKFFNKYCKVTKQIKSYTDLKDINNENNIFIVGSDQVFRPKIAKKQLDAFLLNPINIKSKKIAFSASFGVDKDKFAEETSTKDIAKINNGLKCFDSISCREISGVQICKDLFNTDAELIIDPVFSIEKTEYLNLTKNVKENYKNKIVSYMFNKNNSHKKVEQFLSNKYKKEVIELADSNLSIESWLTAIKDCEFLITNSYHGTCFAIIFNKPFICLSAEMNGSARFDSLFEILSIKPILIKSIDEIYKAKCINYPDYDAISNKIKSESKKGIEYLKYAINAPKCITENSLMAKVSALENLILDIEQNNNLRNQIKRYLWEKWLDIFYHLPKPIQHILQNLRGK